ncbi:MAG: ribonuclease J [Candidatus Nomurabacteria bacterium]|jgi:ribonuclease J|nr:ribonuclease J [Candidatus Nomurabacteria bacterium]
MGQQRLAESQADDLSKRPTTRQKTGNSVLDATTTRRGEVMRAQRRVSDNVNLRASIMDISMPVNKSIFNGFGGEQYNTTEGKKRATLGKTKTKDKPCLKVIPVGGTEIGKNTTALQYDDEIVVIDMGFMFPGDDFPGINYVVPDITYLEERKEQIKAVVFTHGHLDHIGAFHHMIPKIPAPVYATKFTTEMLKKNMEEEDTDFTPDYHVLNPENHDRVQVGKYFSIELVRVNHSIPDSACVVIRTPVGVVVSSGDWRFTPDPLDGRKFDLERLTEIATTEGIQLLINESTNCEVPGENHATEDEIRMSFETVMNEFPNSRVIISSFSSQIHRLQTAINEAARHGRKVAVAGYSMINNVEIALRTGDLRIPNNTIMKLEDIVNLPDSQVCILCTGNQGELNAVLNRMASGAHRWIKIKNSDIIVLSSSRIPGNEGHVAMMEDNLIREGCDVISKNNAAFYGVGAVHTGGHGHHDDHVKFINALNPKFYFPNHGDFTFLVHNAELAHRDCGIPKQNIFVCDAGDTVEFYHDGTAARTGRVYVGNVMYDNAGAVVSDVVLKDRIHMSTEGIFVVVLTIQRGTGRMLSSPDIISRGFIYLRDSEDLINSIRQYVKQKVARVYASRRVDMDDFKRDLRDEISQILYDQTQHNPIVIPVINEIGSTNSSPARRTEQRFEDRNRDFEQQEIARIKGQTSAHFAPRKPFNNQNKTSSFGGNSQKFSGPQKIVRRPNAASFSPTRPVAKKPAAPISFKKTPVTGPNPMRMWREQ